MVITFKASRWNEENLANRICQMMYGGDRVVKDGEGSWHIGSANDMRLHPMGDGVYDLTYRYGTDDLKKAFAAILEWRLAVEIVTDDR